MYCNVHRFFNYHVTNLETFIKRSTVYRPVTREGAGESPLQIFSPTLDNRVGLGLKLLDIVLKIWVPLRELFTPQVSQAGYGPDCI